MSRPPAGLMIDAGINIAAATLALRTMSFRRIAELVSKRSEDRPCPLDQARVIRRAIEAWARRLPWRTLCFEQGLAAHWMLRRRGFASTLHYGAVTTDGELKAHVWVMSGEIPVVGCDNKDDFALLTRFPDDRSAFTPGSPPVG